MAKSVLRQFDVVKKTGGDPPGINEASNALAALALELDSESVSPVGDDDEDDDEDEEDEKASDEDNEDDNDDVGGLGDGRDGMSQEELAQLETGIVPIRLMLTKVS